MEALILIICIPVVMAGAPILFVIWSRRRMWMNSTDGYPLNQDKHKAYASEGASMANNDEFNKGADWMLESLTSEQAEAHVEAAIRDALGDPRHPNIDNLNEAYAGEMDINGSFSISIIAQASVMALYNAKTSGQSANHITRPVKPGPHQNGGGYFHATNEGAINE